MLIDEFIFKLATVVDSSGFDKMAKSVNKVDQSVNGTDKSINSKLGGWKMKFAALGGFVTLISMGLIQLARSSLEWIQKLADGADAKTKRSIIEAQKQFAVIQKQLGNMFLEFKRGVLLTVLPYILKIISATKDWIKANKQLVQDGLNKIKSAFDSVIQVLNSFLKFIDRTIGFKNAIMLVVGAVLLLKKALIFSAAKSGLAFLLSPLGLVAAAIGVILLLVDDLVGYMDGKKSFFGKYWDPVIAGMKTLKTWFTSIIGAVKEWWAESGPVIIAGLKKIWEMVKEVVGFCVGFIIDNFDTIKKIFKSVFNIIVGLIKTLAGIVNYFIALITGDWETMGLETQRIWEGLEQFFVGVGEFIINVFKLLGAYIYAMFEETIDSVFNAWTAFKAKLSALLNGLKATASAAANGIKAVFGAAADWILNKFAPLKNLFAGLIEGAKKLTGINLGGMTDSASSSARPSREKNVEHKSGVKTGLVSSSNVAKKDSKTVINIYGSDNERMLKFARDDADRREARAYHNQGSEIIA